MSELKFLSLPNAPADRAGTAPATAPPWHPSESIVESEVGVPYLAAAFEAPPVLHDDVPSLDVLCGILGLGRSSRLRRSLQYSLGIVSRVSAGVASYRDTGVVAIRAVGAGNAGPDAIMEEISTELRRLRTEPVSDEEMAKSIRRLEAGYALEHETVESVAMTLGFFELHGDWRRSEEYIDRLAAASRDDLLRVANEYLSLEKLSVSAVVPRGAGGARLRDAATSRERAAEAPDAALAESGDKGAGWTAPSVFSRPSMLLESGERLSRRVELQSGGTLIVNEARAVPLISVAFGFAGGFLDEHDEETGLTKAMLHHMLKGTSQRPGDRLSDEMEGLGSGCSRGIE